MSKRATYTKHSRCQCSPKACIHLPVLTACLHLPHLNRPVRLHANNIFNRSNNQKKQENSRQQTSHTVCNTWWAVLQSRGNVGNVIPPNIFGRECHSSNNIRTKGNGNTVAFSQIGSTAPVSLLSKHAWLIEFAIFSFTIQDATIIYRDFPATYTVFQKRKPSNFWQ